MLSNSLIAKLRADYPTFTFQNASVSRWSPRDSTVYFRSSRGAGARTLLHELGHAIRGHTTYHQDIELLRCEREAWVTAQSIASRYHIEITDEQVSDAMATYRQWLHDRSRCPRCDAGSPQQHSSLSYRCMLCGTTWHANDARQCDLRRYKVT